jgi:hypothetical protein
MRVLVRCVFVALMPALSGCITSETLIKLNADRSGTLEQLILVNMKTLEDMPRMMADMLGGDVKSSKSSATSSSPLDALDETRLRAEAPTFGEGVRFVSVEKLARGDMQGARVIYAFDDVNALVIDQEPTMGAMGNAASNAGAADVLDLGLTRLPNGNALLTVRFDEVKAAKDTSTGATKSPKDGLPPGMEDMIKQLFDGFRVAVDVEVNGPIVRTSSPYVAGSRVTVLELDLGMMVRDQANLKVLERLSPGGGVAEMIPMLKGIKGIKVNESPLIVEFTGG